jgi:hypothetical protein
MVKEKRSRTRSAVVIVLAVLVLAVGFVLLGAMYGDKPSMLSFFIRVFAVVGKQRVLYGINHRRAAESLRTFALQNRWDLPLAERPMSFIPSDSSAFPDGLRRFKASSIRIYDDRVELEFGGTPLHYGLVVFRDGDGHGLKKLAEGVWFYSEDGRTSIL